MRLRYLGWLLLCSAHADASLLLSEDFNNISTLAGAGWSLTNNSVPLGTTGWFQGNDSVFTAQAGVATSYIAANFNNADAAGGNISNWLLTPILNLNNGDQLTFYARSAGTLPDGLEVRLSSNGASTNVGATATSVGDFTSLLLAINPSYTGPGFPDTWTLETITLSGLGSSISGRLAFRYVVPDTTLNGDYIGIDTLRVTAASAPAPSTLFCLGLGLGLGLVAVRRGRAAPDTLSRLPECRAA
jgi:hypothetical protein